MAKTCSKILAIAAAAMTVLASCSKGSIQPKEGEETNTPEVKVGDYYGFAQFSVPAATKTVFVEYTGSDKAGKVIEVPVKPVVAAPQDGKDPEPFGLVELLIKANVPTKVSVYSTANQRSEKIYSISNLPIEQTSLDQASSSAQKLELAEPAPYVTTAQDQTFYHSSGTVMFDDSWPVLPEVRNGTIDSDYNDVVLDYDIEARTVSNSVLESDGWREQIRAVLHVRAVGGSNPRRAGLVLEGLDKKYIENIEHYVTLDSYDNPHGDLPKWVNSNIGKNSFYNVNTALRPFMEIININYLNQAVAGSKSGEYTYTNNGKSHKTVFNPGRGYWNAPDQSQFQAGIAPYSGRYYNTTPGYVNVAGGLITYTVIFNIKSRANMTAEDSEKCLKNIIDAVNNTANQNFYIITSTALPICVKGYKPLDKDNSRYTQGYNSNKNNLDEEISYYGKDGSIWAFKVPTLTRHAWEKYAFDLAYPKFANYISTKGEEDVDWYLYPDEKYVTCWW